MAPKKPRQGDPNRKARRRAQLKARARHRDAEDPTAQLNPTAGLGKLGPFPVSNYLRQIQVVIDYNRGADDTWTATITRSGAVPTRIHADDLHNAFHLVVDQLEDIADAAPGSQIDATHRIDGDHDKWLDTTFELGFSYCVLETIGITSYPTVFRRTAPCGRPPAK